MPKKNEKLMVIIRKEKYPGEDVQKLKSSCIADGNVKWYRC
jgi:hypothetical protein